MRTGWRYESVRHSLAARGVRTGNARQRSMHSLASKGIKTVQRKPSSCRIDGIRFQIEQLKDGEVYPVTPGDVQKELLRMSPEDRKRLEAVEFVRPKGMQKEAYAQYVRSKRKVLVFSQPMSDTGRVDGKDPRVLRKWMKGYVLPHEIGHHRALTVHGKTDRSLAVAEGRADAVAARMHPMDRDAVRFARFHKDE